MATTTSGLSRLRLWFFWECVSKNLTWQSFQSICFIQRVPPSDQRGRFNWSSEERRCQHKHFVGKAWFILVALTRATEDFCSQTKVKDRFLNQRRGTCWYSCRKNMQVLSATASLVLVFVLKSFYLCCLPHVMLWMLSLHFFILLFIWFLSVQPSVVLLVGVYYTACDVSYNTPSLIHCC